MKKNLTTIITVVALVASSCAQGTVNFANSAASLVVLMPNPMPNPNDPTPINMPLGGGRVELLWAEVGTTDLGFFSSVAITGFNTVPGRFSGGTVTVPTPVAGGPVALVVRGWTGLALTWTEININTAFFGYSSIFTLAVTGNPTTVPPGTPASINPAFTGIRMQPIPEPSSMALAGLGTVSLFLFRRRAALVS